MITIIDYNAGNIGSIKNMLNKLGYDSNISANKEDILNAKKLILPGVGSFDYGMSMLKEFDLLDSINQKVLEEKIPILGICLGAQLFCKTSEEGILPGLGWIDAEVKKFPKHENKRKYPVPHIGWDYLDIKKNSKLFTDLPENQKFYFVHSYYIKSLKENYVISSNEYGLAFDSSLEKGNIVGVQFHPEKSHKFGMKLLDNFQKYF